MEKGSIGVLVVIFGAYSFMKAMRDADPQAKVKAGLLMGVGAALLSIRLIFR